MFTKILEVKKTAYRQVGAAKYKRKAVKYGNKPRALKQKLKGNSKINDQIKKSLYNWIMHHQEVMQSPIINNCLKVKIDGHTEPQLVTKFLLQVSVRELHNNLVSLAKDGGIKETRYEDYNTIIINYKLCSLFPPQFKRCRQNTRSCVVANVAYLKKYVFVYMPSTRVLSKFRFNNSLT